MCVCVCVYMYIYIYIYIYISIYHIGNVDVWCADGWTPLRSSPVHPRPTYRNLYIYIEREREMNFLKYIYICMYVCIYAFMTPLRSSPAHP